MLKAKQAGLLQRANVQLLDIRNSEIKYYQNYFTVYSELAALCASLIVNTVTQVQAYEYEVERLLKSWFWISCTLTIVFGIHCTITASVSLVYGLGLAIKGPLGSMVRAIKGMEKASKIVYRTFLYSVIGFLVVNTATFWMVAYFWEAVACTFILGSCGIITFYHALEVQRRFYYPELTEDSEWDQSFQEKIRTRSNYSETSPWLNVGRDSDARSARSQNDMQKSLINNEHVTDLYQAHLNGTGRGTGIGSEEEMLAMELYHEGYMMVKSGENVLFSGWERYYFVLSGMGLWYYKDKQTYDNNPDNPIRMRPIELENYYIQDLESLTITSKPNKPNSNKKVIGEKFKFILLPYEENNQTSRPWKFRCDTMDEMTQWLGLISKCSSDEV